MNFEQLKNNRSNTLASLQKKIEESKKKRSYTDERMWKPTADKAGNVLATIRFLPNPDDAENPFVTYKDHFFQTATGQWYAERCPTSIGLPCPVCDANVELWKAGTEEAKKLCRNRGAKKHNICNIYVISDPQNKENEGKVFLYDMGQTILKKIADAANTEGRPVEEGEVVFDPFDMWGGANFKLVGSMDGALRKYDESKFLNPAPLLKGDDKALEEVYNKLYSLKEFLDPKNFKTYQELETRFEAVNQPRENNKNKGTVADETGEMETAAGEGDGSEQSSLEYFKGMDKDGE